MSSLVKLPKIRKKKKDKPRPKYKGSGLRIVDEDNFSSFRVNVSDDDDQDVEELPQIAAVHDDRPEDVKARELFDKGNNKWKQMSEVSSSKERRPHDSSDDDESRPTRRHDSDEDNSPPRNSRRHDSGEDSPPRIVKKSTNASRHDSDEDLSPPRKRPNASPPRRNRKDSDDDLSPPRRRKIDDDLSPPRRTVRDLSPPRRNNRDLFPPRRRNNSPRRNDHSPPRRESSSHPRRRDSPSPPRGSRHESNRSTASSSRSRWNQDDSPPRRQQQYPDNNRRRIEEPCILEENDNESNSGGRMSKTLDGKKAGLQRASALKSELTDLRAKEDEMFANMDDEILGKNAKTKVRDKETGKLKDYAKEAEENAAKAKKAAEWKAQYDKWGRGLKQVEDMAEKVSSVVHEMSKPLARYSDDKDLDDYLKNQERDGDPMLKFLSKKPEKPGALGGGSRKPMYMGPPPAPNRFNIRPGARWDGVDRSNGYEKEWFGRINAKKAFMDEAYKWSSEDL